MDLKPRAFELLAFFLRNPGQVFTRDQLLERVWGYDYPGETRTVDVQEGGVTLPFTVGSDWGSGAYVLATLLKPMDVVAKRMPSRSMDVIRISPAPASTQRWMWSSSAPGYRMPPHA